MDLDDRCPAACLPFGLVCRSCVERSAAMVAAICRGMTPDGVGSVFIQVYPSAGCAPMAHTFENAYFDAQAPRKPMIRETVAA